jgi:transposase
MQNVLESLSKADLIALIEQREMLIQQKDFTIQRMDSTIQELGASIQDKETQIAKLQRMLYGQKRERFTKSPIQLPLDFGQQLSQQEIKEIEELINTKAQVHKEDLAKQPRQPHPGRSPLPKHLAVEEIVIEPVEDTTGMVLMGRKSLTACSMCPPVFISSGSSVPNTSSLPKALTRCPVLPSLRYRSPRLANVWLAQGSLPRC